jgi:hypothetical protein
MKNISRNGNLNMKTNEAETDLEEKGNFDH